MKGGNHTVPVRTPHGREFILSGRKDQVLLDAHHWGGVKLGDSLSLHAGEHAATVTCRQVERYVFRLERHHCPVYNRPYHDLALKGLSESQKARLAEREGLTDFKELAELLRALYGSVAVEMIALRWDALKPAERSSPPESQSPAPEPPGPSGVQEKH